MSETLKPCPRCQKADNLAFVQVCSDGGWGVACHDCHLTLDTRAETQAYAAIEWNRRSPAGAGEVEPVAWIVRHLEDGPTFVDHRKAQDFAKLCGGRVEPLYGAPPPAWKPDREAVAREIEPACWDVFNECGRDFSHPYLDQKVVLKDKIRASLVRADAILALPAGRSALSDQGGE